VVTSLALIETNFLIHIQLLFIEIMAYNKYVFCLTFLCFFVLDAALVQGGATKETSDPVVLRSGVTLREFDENVQRAAAQTSIQDCLCQCHWQTFRDRYGRTHGNCKSTDHTKAQWCYVRSPVKTYLGNHGYSTCSDLQRSGRYPGMTWSYQACATPYLTDDVCSYLLQSHYNNHNNGNYRNPIKPRIGENTNEGNFKDKDGKIKQGNKWQKFPSGITLTGSRPNFQQNSKDENIDEKTTAKPHKPTSFENRSTTPKPHKPTSFGNRSTTPKNVDVDAVVFG